MNKYIFSPIFALILGLANNLIVPFVGEVTGSFILIVLTMPFWLSQIDQNDKIVGAKIIPMFIIGSIYHRVVP